MYKTNELVVGLAKNDVISLSNNMQEWTDKAWCGKCTIFAYRYVYIQLLKIQHTSRFQIAIANFRDKD